MWLFSQKIDLFGLFLPVWLSWIVCFLLPKSVLDQTTPLWVWVLVVMCIDVSHVWSTIFRTYLDKEEFKNHKKMLVITPILVFLGLSVIAFFSVLWFWRVMAYLALHHFIKQQYGFLVLYQIKNGEFIKKNEKQIKWFSDKNILYFSMLYPVFFWHLAEKREFQWFYMGDFWHFLGYTKFYTSFLNNYWIYFHILYWIIILYWLYNELFSKNFQKNQKIALGKIFWVMTTAINWFLGIVYFNADITFTLTNVIAHGLPYMILLFFYVEKKKYNSPPAKPPSPQRGSKFKEGVKSAFISMKNLILMLIFVLLLGFLEEYCWDWWINRQKTEFFSYFLIYPSELIQNSYIKAMCFGLLAMPQVAHYIIDGYIWRNNKKNPHLREIIFGGK